MEGELRNVVVGLECAEKLLIVHARHHAPQSMGRPALIGPNGRTWKEVALYLLEICDEPVTAALMSVVFGATYLHQLDFATMGRGFQ